MQVRSLLGGSAGLRVRPLIRSLTGVVPSSFIPDPLNPAVTIEDATAYNQLQIVVATDPNLRPVELSTSTAYNQAQVVSGADPELRPITISASTTYNQPQVIL